MPRLDGNSQPDGATDHLSETRSRIKAVDRWDWWVWTSASVVMLLLISVTFVLVHSGGEARTDVYFQFDREQAVRGLLGVTLLFIVHSFYQQTRIKALRRELSGKIERLVSVEGHAEEFEKLSVLDFLTGLYNRRFVEKHLDVEVARAQRLGHRCP